MTTNRSVIVGAILIAVVAVLAYFLLTAQDATPPATSPAADKRAEEIGLTEMPSTDERTWVENVLAAVWLSALITFGSLLLNALLDGVRQDECQRRGAALCAPPTESRAADAPGRLGIYLRDGRQW